MAAIRVFAVIFWIAVLAVSQARAQQVEVAITEGHTLAPR